MPSAIGPPNQLFSDFVSISRVRGLFLSRLGEESFSMPDTTHWTMVRFSKTSCMTKAPSPTQPYCLSTSKYLSPRAAFAFSSGTRFLQSQNPAGSGGNCSVVVKPWRTCSRTVLKIPSAPITASNWYLVVSSWKFISMPDSLGVIVVSFLLG